VGTPVVQYIQPVVDLDNRPFKCFDHVGLDRDIIEKVKAILAQTFRD
jgi:hypothetical protein